MEKRKKRAPHASPIGEHRYPAAKGEAPAECLAAFSLGLTFNGMMLMLNRGFFSQQRPWVPTWVALCNLGLNAALDAAFYRFGIWGIPLATSLVNIAGTAALIVLFRRRLGRMDGSAIVSSYARIAAASAAAAGAAFGVWFVLDETLGRSLLAQIASVGLGTAAGVAAFLGLALFLRVRELQAVLSLRRRSATTDTE